jgi:L-histidine N-alpha-methyltransferase
MLRVQDFVDLFRREKQGHLGKYVYEYRPDIYESILNQESYYPFHIESFLISKYAKNIITHLGKVGCVLELGPGSECPINYKTVPLLKEFIKIGVYPAYWAIDTLKLYADQACALIKKTIPSISTQSYCSDFSGESGLLPLGDISGAKLIVCFGQSIFANNAPEISEIILKNIAAIMRPDDYLLIGLDMTRDQEKIEKAYNTDLGQQLLFNAFFYLQKELNPKGFDPEQFQHQYNWNTLKNRVELSFVALSDQQFELDKQYIHIQQGDQFILMYSYKPDFLEIVDLLTVAGLSVVSGLIDEVKNDQYSFLLIKRTL